MKTGLTDFNTPEIAICAEDINDNTIGKFYIPILTPFLEFDEPYDKPDMYGLKKNIINKKEVSKAITPCITSNYIELPLPNGITNAKKGDKFVVIFMHGDLNDPLLLGRYR